MLFRSASLPGAATPSDFAPWQAGFDRLGQHAQEAVLKALVNAAITEGLRPGEDASQRRLARYDQAIALGTSSPPGAATPSDFVPWQAGFDRLGQDAQAHVVKALVNAAITEGRRPGEDAAWRALARFNQAIALCTASPPGAATPSDFAPWQAGFDKLRPNTQTSVLKALVYAGETEGQRPGEVAARRELARYDQAIALATASMPVAAEPTDVARWRARFGGLGQDAQATLLTVLVNAGIAEGRLSGESAARRALARFDQAIVLCTAVCIQPPPTAQE